MSTVLSRYSLSFQLALLVLTTALPLMLAGVLMYNLLIENERDNIRQSLAVGAKTLAGLVDNEIDTHTALAYALAQSPALQRSDLQVFWSEANRALEFLPGAWIEISDPQGQIVANTLTPLGSPLPRHAAPEVVQRAFQTRQPQIGNLVVGPVSKRLRAFVEVPVFRENVPLYSLAISLTPERFLAVLKDKYTRGEVAGIVDGSLNFVARVPDHDATLGKPATPGFRAALAKATEGWTESKTVEGQWSITGFARTGYGWSVGIGRLDANIGRPHTRIFWSTLIGVLLLTLASLAIAGLIAGNASSGMRALASAARALGQRQALRIETQPFAEAGAIADTLVDAAAELKRREELLERANALLEDRVAARTRELVSEMQRREQSETTLRQVQKMETIGQLTGGIAHDFNNMLTVVIGNLDTVQRRLKSIDNAAMLNRPVEAALQGARNAARLTHRLLAFARQQPLEPVSVRLDSLIAGFSDVLTRTVGEMVQVEVVSGAGLWETLVDANQLENCILNLVVNARDAMPNGGKLTIETANTYLDDTYVSKFGDLKSGPFVLLSVSDTGSGIPGDILEKVCEPFFTTKEAGKGTGFGLAMVHGFVKQSGGHLRIYSEVNQGTTVKIYLPKLVQPERAAFPPTVVASSSPVRRAKPGETVLVVEDDREVQDYAIETLEDLGYQVVAGADGDTALNIAASTQRIDVVFTDVVLGGRLNGRQLADEISKLRPRTPIVFTTGYTRNAIVHHGRLDAGVRLVNKPYSQLLLAETIRAAIDATALNDRRNVSLGDSAASNLGNRTVPTALGK